MSSRLGDRHLYLCTPDRPDLAQFLSACIAGGVDVVQLRDRQLGDLALIERARLAQAVCGDLGVPFIVNDRPDLALFTGADGVHVGQDDTPPALCREILGETAIVGRSTHSVDDLERALREPVTYLSAGPVVPTPTKPGRPGTGVEYVACAVSRSTVPVFVTGGVSPERVPELVRAGVRHFVVVRWLFEAGDPQRAARALRQAIDESLERADAAPTPTAGAPPTR